MALLDSSNDNDGRIKFVIIGIKMFSSTRIDEFQEKNCKSVFNQALEFLCIKICQEIKYWNKNAKKQCM